MSIISSSSSDDDHVSAIIQETIMVVRDVQEAYGLDSSSEDEVPPEQRLRRRYIERNRTAAHERLVNDYFIPGAIFEGYNFRRRFRMYKPLFERIVAALTASSRFFQQHPNARGIPGFTPLQKCTCALRQLAYGTPADALDESFRMSAKTARLSLHHFCKQIARVFGPRYLRRPTRRDILKLQAHHATVHGFPGMLGSLDCMHWDWANCPTAHAGQYTRGDHGSPTVILEAVASQDEWFWWGFFGTPGSLNDINVLNRSEIFNNIYDGTAPDSSFHVLGIPYGHGYYLVDGIYPEWAVFVKSWTHPHDEKRRKFKKAQERARKDVERAFGALKKRWAIIAKPSLFFTVEKMKEVMQTCMILHNMIIEDEGRAICGYDPDEEDEVVPETQPINQDDDDVYLALRAAVRSNTVHQSLRADLVEHIYGVDNIDLNVPLQTNDDLDFSDAEEF